MSSTVPPQVEKLLTSEPLVAHLATSTDDRPHVTPLWYRYEDGIIEVMTTGRALSNIKENPRVSLSVQRDRDGHPEWTVTLRGTATIVEDEETNRRRNRVLNRVYNADEGSWEDENTLVRIEIGSVSFKTY